MKLINKLVALLKKFLTMLLKPFKMVSKMSCCPVKIGLLFTAIVVVYLMVVTYRNREQFTTLSQAAPLNPINNKSQSAKF